MLPGTVLLGEHGFILTGPDVLAAGKGTPIHLHTEGEQDDDALNALIELINNYFDEGE